MSFIDQLKTLPQYLIPQHFLSVLVHKLMHLRLGRFTHWCIKKFIALYKVDMSLAQAPDPQAYPFFNAFFTRALKADARPLANTDFVSPVDGAISQIGQIETGRIFQAKGHSFTATELLASSPEQAAVFDTGLFTTVYLSPRDYHRIHMPVTGRLTKMTYIPGKLFSVNQRTVGVVPRLFARNERLVCHFDTEFGQIALVLVGAIFVGSMETVWAGKITPPYTQEIKHWDYNQEEAPVLQKGEELGRFNMGSTIVLLTEADKIIWGKDLKSGSIVQMGQALSQ